MTESSSSTWCHKMPWGPHLVKPAHHKWGGQASIAIALRFQLSISPSCHICWAAAFRIVKFDCPNEQTYSSALRLRIFGGRGGVMAKTRIVMQKSITVGGGGGVKEQPLRKLRKLEKRQRLSQKTGPCGAPDSIVRDL